MDITKIQSLEDLEGMGPVDEVKKRLSVIVAPLKIDAATYGELLEVVRVLQDKWIDYYQGPFISRRAELVFYLTKLEGKERNEKLGISEEHYRNKKLAKQWYRDIAKYVHSDGGGDDRAFQELGRIYKNLIEVDADV